MNAIGGGTRYSGWSRSVSAAILSISLGLTGSRAAAQLPDPQEQFHSAVAAQQRGDSATAITLYGEILKRHPDALAVRANMAGLLAETGQTAKAIEAYDAALRLAPTDRSLHLGLAYAHGQRGDPSDLRAAVEELEPLHASDPGDEQARMLLGDAYARQGRYAQAAAMLQPLERTHPDDRDIEWLLGSSLVRSGHPAEGTERLDRLIARGAGDVSLYLLAGEARLELQQFDQARADVDAALKLNETSPEAQILLGRLLEQTGDQAGAETALRRGLQTNVRDFDGHFSLGALLLFQRKLPEAAEQLRLALEIQPDSAEARYKLAMTEQAQGQDEAALRDLQTVTHERTDWLAAQSALLALLYRLHRESEAAQVKQTVAKLTAQP